MSDLLPIGTKVKMSKVGKADYSHSTLRNPHDDEGTITRYLTDTHAPWVYYVDWDNGRWNHYRSEDLDTLEPTPTTPTFKVGDKVRAKEETPYCITDNGWEGYVKAVNGDELTVGTSMEDIWPEYHGVEAKYFDLVETKQEPVASMHQPVALLPDMPIDVVPTPIDAPTKWADMDAEQKGALLLAHHNGEEIQYHSDIFDGWTTCSGTPCWGSQDAYRVVTPEMKKAEELKELRSRIAELEDELSPPVTPVLTTTSTIRVEPVAFWH